MKNCDISMVDFIYRTEHFPLRMASTEFLVNFKKDRMIITMIRIESLRKRIAESPKNRVLKLSLLLAESKLRRQQERYLKFVEIYNVE